MAIYKVSGLNIKETGFYEFNEWFYNGYKTEVPGGYGNLRGLSIKLNPSSG